MGARNSLGSLAILPLRGCPDLGMAMIEAKGGEAEGAVSGWMVSAVVILALGVKVIGLNHFESL